MQARAGRVSAAAVPGRIAAPLRQEARCSRAASAMPPAAITCASCSSWVRVVIHRRPHAVVLGAIVEGPSVKSSGDKGCLQGVAGVAGNEGGSG